MDISTELVKALIKQQFPQWQDLTIKPVQYSGHDNRTFHLGHDMLIRLPSAQCYAPQVPKEQVWLPKLAPKLSLQIPSPIDSGRPSEAYPYPWSIYQWISGQSANQIDKSSIDLDKLAIDLATFLNELHLINTKDGPKSGEHNFYRGAHWRVYDDEAKKAIQKHQHQLDTHKANMLLEQARITSWQSKEVWVHGDLSPGNCLLQNNQLTAIIDFGLLAIGDPACDLMIAWTYLNKSARSKFKKHLNIDNDTWQRAKAWTLWKCLQDSGPESQNRQQILNQLFKE